jgi:mannose-1-phosphate guanylyltransferase
VKALLLAGGFGTRLRPLTYTRPKHLLPIANRPHMEHVFDSLLRQDITELVLLTSYLADAFAEIMNVGRERGLRLEVTREETPLDTAGAIKNAHAIVGDDAFIVLNGDVLTDVDLGEVLRFHRARRAEATLLLTPVEDPSAFGVVPTDEEGRVLGFIEKPPPGGAPTNLINAGVYVMEPSLLDRIPPGQPWSAERQLFPGLVAEGALLYALATDAYWIDIGTPDKLLQANLDALEGRFRSDAIPSPGDGLVLAAEGARVAPTARVSSTCLGSGAAVGDDATVEGSVVMPGAQVGSGATVISSILGEGARVEPGAEAVGATVADHGTAAATRR